MASLLSDLDELVLKCRDQKATSYVKEAVSCYKAGAFRSSIVSTWIAVSFDIIDKLKELDESQVSGPPLNSPLLFLDILQSSNRCNRPVVFKNHHLSDGFCNDG